MTFLNCILAFKWLYFTFQKMIWKLECSDVDELMPITWYWYWEIDTILSWYWYWYWFWCWNVHPDINADELGLSGRQTLIWRWSDADQMQTLIWRRHWSDADELGLKRFADIACHHASINTVITRVGQNYIYMVYIRYFWQGTHLKHDHIRCIYGSGQP